MAAHAVRVGHALRVENVANFVRLVTVHAGGKNVRFLLPECAFDGLAVDLFNLRVAPGAGGGNVAPRDRGVGIGVRQDVMRRVARRAIRRDDQALLEQRLAVNALGIVLENIVLIDLAVGLNRSALAMAAAADEGDVERSDRGTLVLDGKNVVIAVSVHAVRSQRVAAGDGFAVQRCGMLFLLVGVAGAALNGNHARFMGKILPGQIGVARGAGQRRVNRRSELLAIHEQRDRARAALGAHSLVAVAGEAVVVGGVGGAG